MSRRGAGSDTGALATVIGPAVTSAGYDLESVSLSRAGNRSVLRVVVDGDDGVSLDAVAQVSHRISEALDASSDVDGRSAYTLEVTSPGVDRPLTEPRHWRRAAGRLVRVVTGGTPVTGRVLSATDDAVQLDVEGTIRSLSIGELGPGKVQVEFARSGGSPVDTDSEDDDR